MPRVLPTVLGIVAAFAGTGLVAQGETFAEAVKLYRLGKLDEAKQKLEELLATDPSHDQAFELWKSTDHAVWHALMVEQGEIGKIAQHLLDLARVGRQERSRDPEKINALVDQATSGDFGQRRQATMALLSEHGEFAVPALAAKLGDQDNDKGQVFAMLALQQLGRSATLPLVELLKSDQELVRRNAAATLGEIKDERAVAGLKRLAELDASEGVRVTANTILGRLGVPAGKSALDLALAEAAGYLSDRGVHDGDRSDVIWHLEDGKLVFADALPASYHFELARKAAHDALAQAPNNADAKVLLARAYLGEAAVLTDGLGDAGRIADLRMAAAATGLDAVRRAASASIEAAAVPSALAALELLGELESADGVASSPLVAALDHQDDRIGYAAALAITKASGGNAVPAVDRVVRNLSAAVSEETIMVVKVIDHSPATARAVQEATFRRGYQKSVSDSGLSAMNDLFQFPTVDVVVINEILPDARPEAIVGLIRKNPRMQGVKILVLATDPEAAKARFGDKIDGTVAGPASGEALKAAVEAALADVAPDVKRARADKVAEAASLALRDLANRRVNLGDSAATELTKQLDRADSVAIPAAAAIGGSGSINQADALLEVLGRTDASLDLKVGAANALGSIMARSGAVAAPVFDSLFAVLGSGADARLRQAVVQALGRGQLNGDASARLINALRVKPGAAAAPAAATAESTDG